MLRRNFIRNVFAGIGSALALTSIGFDTFATNHGLRPRLAQDPSFPVWDVKWKAFMKPGWKARTRMNVVDGCLPPQDRSLNGIPYSLFKVDEENKRAWYFQDKRIKSRVTNASLAVQGNVENHQKCFVGEDGCWSPIKIVPHGIKYENTVLNNAWERFLGEFYQKNMGTQL